jgi:hypothetical protein
MAQPFIWHVCYYSDIERSYLSNVILPSFQLGASHLNRLRILESKYREREKRILLYTTCKH